MFSLFNFFCLVLRIDVLGALSEVYPKNKRLPALMYEFVGVAFADISGVLMEASNCMENEGDPVPRMLPLGHL